MVKFFYSSYILYHLILSKQFTFNILFYFSATYNISLKLIPFINRYA